ncbi:SMI1/KNR4 family protein [Paenibacillus elgii]
MIEKVYWIKEHLGPYFSRAVDMAFMHVQEKVPQEMRDGEVDEEGWVKWKLLDSTIGEDEIRAVESEYAVEFPPLFKAFLMSYHYVSLQFDNVEVDGEYIGDCQFIEMPSLSSEDKLQSLEFLINAWEPLLSAGYVPFAECEDSQGPVCFDTMRRQEDGDCPVVWFLHDYLHELSEEASRNRDHLAPYVRPIFGSFKEMMTVLCSQESVMENTEE